MDNKKRLDFIKKQAADSQSAKDLQSKPLSEAIHGLSLKDDSATHQEFVDATKHYAAALEKHMRAHAFGKELAALKSAVVHEKESIIGALTHLEDAIQKKIVDTHHLPEEAAVYNLLAKMSNVSRTLLFGQ